MREITQEELERFQNLENEFLSYKTKIESIMKKVQEQGAEQYDEKIYFLKSFQLLLSFIAEKGVIDHEHEEVKNIFTKVYHDLGGIISCLEQGYQVAAIPLIRVLFETTVNVKFIYQDFDKRIKIYEEAKFIEQYKRMDKHDLPEEQKVYIRKNYKRVKNNYDEYKSWYSKYFKQNFLKGTKKSANLRQLAKHVGMDMEYEELYGSFSLVSHGSSAITPIFKKGNNPQITPTYDSSIINLLYMAFHFSYQIVQTILRPYEEFSLLLGTMKRSFEVIFTE